MEQTFGNNYDHEATRRFFRRWWKVLTAVFVVAAIASLVVSLLIFAFEWKKKLTLVWWDLLLMVLQGVMGIVLFVMIFSQHPTTSINFQILLFNPLPFIYIYKVYRRQKTHYWNLLLTMTVLFLLGGIWQSYAEGLYIVALSLLLRFWSNIIHAKK